MKFAKKASSHTSISYEEAREGALRFGWIDGLINSYGDDFCVRKFTQRRPRSRWSKINRGLAEEMIANGLMEPPGLREVEAARADGRWEQAYDSPSQMKIPPDLKSDLAANPKAQKTFQSLSASQRYSILYQLHEAKKPETRQRRKLKYLKMLEEGRRP